MKLPITKAGVYETLDIDDYHTQCCDGPSISSSGLRTIIRECPAIFWATSDLNPNAFKKPDRPALALGRAAHSLVLGEPEFNAKFIVSKFADFRSSEARAWRDAQTRQIVRMEEMPVIQAMADAQRKTRAVARAFTEGKPEVSIIWKDEETGVFVKSRPDWLPDFPALRFTTEYKTCLTIEPRKLSHDVFKFGYELQAALLMDSIKTVMEIEPLGIAHIVQEKAVPFLCDMRMFTPEQIAFGRLEYRKALRIFAECLNTGVWPAYTTEVQFFDTPYWLIKAMENFDAYDPSAAQGINDELVGDDEA